MPVLDIGQKRVLLRAVEAVDLIDEEQRALAHFASFLGRLEDFAQIGNAGKQRRKRLKGEARPLGKQPRDRRLAATRRTPQNHRRQPPASDHPPDRPLGTEQMVLPDDVAELLWPQPVGQRMRRLVFEEGGHRPRDMGRGRLPCKWRPAPLPQAGEGGFGHSPETGEDGGGRTLTLPALRAGSLPLPHCGRGVCLGTLKPHRTRRQRCRAERRRHPPLSP